MAKAVKSNWNRTCRCCMKFGENIGVRSIFDVETDSEVAPPDQLFICADVRVRKDDGLPEGICAGCLADLKNAHRFRNRCLKTQWELFKIFTDIKPVVEKSPLSRDFDEQVILTTAFDDEPSDSTNRQCKTERVLGKINRLSENMQNQTAEKTQTTDKTETAKNAQRKTNTENKLFTQSAKNTPSIEITQSMENEENTQSEDEESAQSEDEDYTQSMENEENTQSEDEENTQIIENEQNMQSKDEENTQSKGTENIMKKHFKEAQEDYICICTICRHMFFSLKSIYNHITRNHPHVKKGTYDMHITYKRITTKDSVKIACINCNMEFASNKLLKQHFKKAHQQPKAAKEHHCSQCPYVTHRRKNLYEHMSKHTATRKQHSCDLCPYVTTHKSSMTVHKQLHLGASFKCLECGKCFKIHRYLTDHLKRVHAVVQKEKVTKEKVVKKEVTKEKVAEEEVNKEKVAEEEVTKKEKVHCQICDATFNTESRRNYHKIVQHIKLVTEENSIVLDDCAITTNNDDSLPVTVFKCSLCSNSTHTSKIMLKYHILKVHKYSGFVFDDKTPLPVFKCNLCSLVTIDRAKYKNHMKRHSMNPVDCHICGLVYKNPDVLANHIRSTHKGICRYKNKFRCYVCNARFADQKSLDVHKRIPGIHPLLSCDKCNYTSITRFLLTKHMKNNHPDEQEAVKKSHTRTIKSLASISKKQEAL